MLCDNVLGTLKNC